MENLKIRVNTPEESERAQRAFFALGVYWRSAAGYRKRDGLQDWIKPFNYYDTSSNVLKDKALYSLNGDLYGFGVEGSFDSSTEKEITLPELEALAEREGKIKRNGDKLAEVTGALSDVDVADFKETTGHNTPQEMAAYEKGREHEQAVIMKFIEAWQGETNSALGALLAKKMRGMVQVFITHIPLLVFTS